MNVTANMVSSGYIVAKTAWFLRNIQDFERDLTRAGDHVNETTVFFEPKN